MIRPLLLLMLISIPLFSGCQGESVGIGDEAPKSNQELAAALEKDMPLIIIFHAEWCPSCKEQVPLVEKVVSRYDELLLVKQDFDKKKEAVSDYGVANIPRTIIIDRNGKISAMLVGVTGEKRLEQEIEKVL